MKSQSWGPSDSKKSYEKIFLNANAAASRRPRLLYFPPIKAAGFLVWPVILHILWSNKLIWRFWIGRRSSWGRGWLWIGTKCLWNWNCCNRAYHQLEFFCLVFHRPNAYISTIGSMIRKSLSVVTISNGTRKIPFVTRSICSNTNHLLFDLITSRN